MIRSEEIKALTGKQIRALSHHSILEYTAHRRELEGVTYAVYDDDSLLLVLNIVRRSLLMPAELYLLVGKAYGPKYAKKSKQVLDSLIYKYGGLYTLINTEFNKGCRFAKFFGFRPRGPYVHYAGETYQLYEVYP